MFRHVLGNVWFLSEAFHIPYQKTAVLFDTNYSCKIPCKILLTKHRIRQSFDGTQLMFSYFLKVLCFSMCWQVICKMFKILIIKMISLLLYDTGLVTFFMQGKVLCFSTLASHLRNVFCLKRKSLVLYDTNRSFEQ